MNEFSEKVRFVHWFDESSLDITTEEKVIELGFDDSDEARFVGKIRHKFMSALQCARVFANEKRALESIGEFARNWFGLCSFRTDRDADRILGEVLEKMNEIDRERFAFKREDAVDAILCRGNFVPIDKKGAEEFCISLMGAQTLIEAGMLSAAAKAAGVNFDSEDQLCEDIRFLDECYRQKIDEGDFEVAPKHEPPDVSKQISELCQVLEELNLNLIKIRKMKTDAVSLGVPEMCESIEQMESQALSEIARVKSSINKYQSGHSS